MTRRQGCGCSFAGVLAFLLWLRCGRLSETVQEYQRILAPNEVHQNPLAAAQTAAAVGTPPPPLLPGAIPKRLHRIYIADPTDKKRLNLTMPLEHLRWIESCQYHYSAHAGWQHYFWDAAASEALIANHYPHFLPFYRASMSKAIEKSDVARYAILHRLGGLYLDSDVECWREGSDMLAGFDLVAQLVEHRSVDTSKDAMEVIARTGPDLFTAALEAAGLTRREGMFREQYHLDGAAYQLWPVRSWFTPCQWWEQDCRRTTYAARASGQIDMGQLVGMHRMVGSWIPGKEDGLGILNVTAELCGTGNHKGSNGKPGGWVAPKADSGNTEQRRK